MVLAKLKARLGKRKRHAYLSLEQTRVLFSFLNKYTSLLCIVLFFIGTGWILLLPHDGYSKHTYVSENALLPGQVNVYYGYNDINAAENYRAELLQLHHQNISARSQYIQGELGKAGFKAVTQDFDIKGISGINTFAIYRTPRSDGKEALVLSAPWTSRTGEANINGLAALLSLSKLFKRNVYWSKDIILLVTDQANAGTQAWLEAYHGIEQQGTYSSLVMPRSGAIQGVVNLDFPGTNDYERLGIFFEGVNGQLPNLDLINTIRIVAESTARIPVTLHDSNDPITLTNDAYWSGLTHLLNSMKSQVFGHPSSDAGLYLRYKIDAVTIHGIHGTNQLHSLFGFHRIGILVESTFRSLNNLLEHFHQSFFFYMLPKPNRYVSIGVYMPPVIVYACCLVFQISFLSSCLSSLRVHIPCHASLILDSHIFSVCAYSLVLYYLDPKMIEAEDREIKLKKAVAAPAYSVYDRPMGSAFAVMAIVLLAGMSLFAVMQPQAMDYFPGDNMIECLGYQIASAGAIAALVVFLASLWIRSHDKTTYDARLLKCLCLAVGAMTIATVSLLNFSLGIATALATIIPYTIVRPSDSLALKALYVALLALVSPLGLTAAYATYANTTIVQVIMPLVWDYQLVHSWFLAYVCTVYWPVNLAMQILVLSS
ncbi:Gaa1-like protein [Gongronella butleri]|nr:Gaa1-like protein [Gongronella butleri]